MIMGGVVMVGDGGGEGEGEGMESMDSRVEWMAALPVCTKEGARANHPGRCLMRQDSGSATCSNRCRFGPVS